MSGIANWQAQIRIDIEDLKKRIKVAEGEINNFTNEDRKVKLDIDTKTLESAIQKLDKMLDSLGKGTGDFKQFENLSKELSSIVSEVQSLSKAFGKVDDSGTKTLLSSIQNIDKSLSELSQNILNVNKNMGNTSGAVKQVENISNAYQDAAKEAEKLADAQSKIGQKTNISLGDSKERSTEIDLYHNLEKRKVTYDEIIDKIQTIVSLKEKEKSLSKTSDDTKLYQNLYDENDINWAGDTEGTINRISDRLKEIYTKYNGKISLIDENDIQEATYLLDILKGSGESPNLNKSQEKFYQNKKFSNDSLFDNIRVDSQKAEEIDKINTELSETYRWFNQLEGVSLNENIANEIKSLISDMQIGGKTASEYANDLLKIFNIEVGSNSAVEQQNKLQSELKETELQAEKTAQAVNESSSTTPEKDSKDAFPDKDVSASVEAATNSIKEENNVLEQNTQKVKENTQAKEQNVNVNLNKYDKRLDSYNDKIDKYKTTIDRFNDGGWTSSTYLENVQAVKNAVKEYETLLNELKGKDASLVTSEDISKLDNYEKKIKDTIATVTNMSASEKGYNFVSGQKELDKIHKLLAENSKMSSEAKAKIRAYYAEIESGNPSMSLDKIHGEILKIYNAEVEAGRAGKTLWDTLKNSGFHQIAAQMAGMFGVYDVINVVRQGVNTVRELDEAMTEVHKVSNATETQYASFRDTISSTAKEIATTNKELLNSSADFLRLGYSLEQASDLAKNATLFVNVGDGVDITEATEDMITAMKAFDIQAKDSIKIVDDYNQIGNQFALSASDIGEAMKRSASALETGNNSFEQSIGLITAMNEIVQNSENTGNSLKVLSLRLRGAKAELEDMQEDTEGLCDSTSKLREQIKSLTGVDIMLDDNTFKSTTDIIKELGAVWDKLSDSSQAATLELIAGKSRANNVAALLKNYQKIDEVMDSLGDAEGSAIRENEAIVDSIDGRIKKLSASMEDFWQKAINTDFVKNIVSSLDTILNLLTKIIDQFGLLPTIIGFGGAGTGIFKFIKNFDWVFKPYTKNSLQQFLVGQS